MELFHISIGAVFGEGTRDELLQRIMRQQADGLYTIVNTPKEDPPVGVGHQFEIILKRGNVLYEAGKTN